MGKVMRDFLIIYRLCPNQCSLNLFQILGSVDGCQVSHHDVNWVYSCHNSKETRYYLKTKVLVVRLISCLPETNKGMDDDYLIVLGDRHDGLHCPTKDGEPSVVIVGLKSQLPLSSQRTPSLVFDFLNFFFFFYKFFKSLYNQLLNFPS